MKYYNEDLVNCMEITLYDCKINPRLFHATFKSWLCLHFLLLQEVLRQKHLLAVEMPKHWQRIVHSQKKNSGVWKCDKMSSLLLVLQCLKQTWCAWGRTLYWDAIRELNYVVCARLRYPTTEVNRDIRVFVEKSLFWNNSVIE